MIIKDIMQDSSIDILKEMDDKENLLELEKAVNELKDNEKEIISYRYGLFGKDELTQKETADLLGISQSYISRLEKKIIKKLYMVMKK